jgi:hypothetical protein
MQTLPLSIKKVTERVIINNFVKFDSDFFGSGAAALLRNLQNFSQAAEYGCGFNRSMQHLISYIREEDVEDEATTEDLLHRGTESPNVGSLAAR